MGIESKHKRCLYEFIFFLKIIHIKEIYMKTLKSCIVENQNIGEAREQEYRAALIDVTDDFGMPCTVTISVPIKCVKKFEKWLEDEQDNIFAHAEGGNIEY